MSIVITPGPTQLRREPTPAGRLAASLLSVTVAGLADPQRFRRGKAYLADNAIARLELSEGVLLATVVGGRPEPYHVTITVETVTRPDDLGQVPERAHVARLIPRGEELLCSCTCPDWDDPCKHGVAALLALAGELGSRPELLITWRCGDGDARPPAPGSAPGLATDRHLRLVPPTPPPSPFETPEWHEFAGDDLAVPQCTVPTGSLTLPAMHLDRTDVAEVIRSAWQGPQPVQSRASRQRFAGAVAHRRSGVKAEPRERLGSDARTASCNTCGARSARGRGRPPGGPLPEAGGPGGPPSATGRHVFRGGDGEVGVDLDDDLRAVGLGHVSLVRRAGRVGLDPDDRSVGDRRLRRSGDARCSVTGQRGLAGAGTALAARPTGPTLGLIDGAGDCIVGTDLDDDMRAVSLGDVSLVDAVVVGLDTIDRPVGHRSLGGSRDLRGDVAGHGPP